MTAFDWACLAALVYVLIVLWLEVQHDMLDKQRERDRRNLGRNT